MNAAIQRCLAACQGEIRLASSRLLQGGAEPEIAGGSDGDRINYDQGSCEEAKMNDEVLQQLRIRVAEDRRLARYTQLLAADSRLLLSRVLRNMVDDELRRIDKSRINLVNAAASRH